MRLGMPADQWSTSEARPTISRRERCERWRAVVLSLGETYAGHTLRRTVLRRHCDMLAPLQHAVHWNWPWDALSGDGVLPPRLHKAFGPWSIRCGGGEASERCALIYSATATKPDKAGAGARNSRKQGGAAPAISTHFVIDQVQGREMLLWRLFVPETVSRRGHTSHAAKTHGNTAGRNTSVEPAGRVQVQLGRRRFEERFTVCRPAGCLMEARGERAGTTATFLANGRAVHVSIRRQGRPTRHLTLGGGRFSPALGELMRLRRAEGQATSGRR